ncbi:MAG: helix-turn-helix domain-containing protein [Cyanobacteria bacterium P01_D01_bin.50]
MRLERKHKAAIVLMVAGKSQREIAKQLDVSQATISIWRNDFDFNHALQQAFSNAYDDAINKLAAISKKAVDELDVLISSEETPIKFKLQAISLILTHGEKAKQYQLEHRLQRLEELAFNEVEDETIINSEIESN